MFCVSPTGGPSLSDFMEILPMTPIPPGELYQGLREQIEMLNQRIILLRGELITCGSEEHHAYENHIRALRAERVLVVKQLDGLPRPRSVHLFLGLLQRLFRPVSES